MKTEGVLFGLFLMACAMWILRLPFTALSLITTCSAWAIVYFPAAFYFMSYNKIEGRTVGWSIGTGLFASMVVTGMLFKILRWPGANLLLVFGTPPMFFMFLIALGKLPKATGNSKGYFRNMAIRTASLCAIGILWLSISTATLIRFANRHDPTLVDLEIQVLENPDCLECKQKLDQYKKENYSYPKSQ